MAHCCVHSPRLPVPRNYTSASRLASWPQADLIGTAKEGERDDRVRARLHAAWLQEQDQDDMARVVAGVRRGWHRPGAADGLYNDDEVS